MNISGRGIRGVVVKPPEDNMTRLLNKWSAYLPPSDHEGDWRALDLDYQTLSTLTTAELIRYLVDLSPEISRAIWDYLRMCNPGSTCKVFFLGKGDVAHDEGQRVLDEFVTNVTLSSFIGGSQKSPIDLFYDSLFMQTFVRGAALAELLVDKRYIPVDLDAPDPDWIRFKRVWKDGRYYWQMGQQGTEWIPIESPMVSYTPIDPYPGEPYGRPIISPAVFPALFLLSMLHDLKKVIQQQGYPRINIKVLLEHLQASMPADIENSPDKVKEWVDAQIQEVADGYGALQPDSAYVHTDVVEVGEKPIGTTDGSSLGIISALINSLERILARALKTMPLLLGIEGSVTETHANRQWEVYLGGVSSIQEMVEGVVKNLYAMVLQLNGIQARVDFKFAELRKSEELRDQQTQALKIANNTKAREQGWISQDQAAQNTFSQPAVADPPDKEEPLPSDGNLMVDETGEKAAAEDLIGAVRRVENLTTAFMRTLMAGQ